jgi:hypothetical protein
MYRHRWIAMPAGMALVTMALGAGANEHREHGAHVHGVGQLNAVLDGTTLEIELDSPAANLVGFEHAPRNDEEHARYDKTFAQLRQGEVLFILPVAAGCRLDSVNLTEEGVADPKAEHHHDGDEAEHSHSDINGYYRFHCAKPEALNAIEVHLFELFPATKSLEVQSIGPNGQGGGKLTADDPILSF